MRSDHRKNAVIGMVVWFGLTFVFAALWVGFHLKQAWTANISGEVALAIVAVTLIVPFLSFFWTAHHLAKARGQTNSLMVLGIFGPLAQLIMLVVLMTLPDRNAQPERRKSSPKKYNSPVERIFYYRTKALPRVILGFSGILFAIYLCLFSGFWFEDPENQLIVALFIFLFGYAGVISGSSFWVKAKGWNDAMVFIGLSPLVIIFIPWVRLIFVVMPLLLPTLMVMMPIILLIVVASLPDRSGLPKRSGFDISKIRQSDEEN